MRCLKCGRAGLFLKVSKRNLCEQCENRLRMISYKQVLESFTLILQSPNPKTVRERVDFIMPQIDLALEFYPFIADEWDEIVPLEPTDIYSIIHELIHDLDADSPLNCPKIEFASEREKLAELRDYYNRKTETIEDSITGEIKNAFEYYTMDYYKTGNQDSLLSLILLCGNNKYLSQTKYFRINYLVNDLYRKRNEGDNLNQCIEWCVEGVRSFEVWHPYPEDGGMTSPTFFHLALTYERQGKYEEAIDICNKAIKYNIIGTYDKIKERCLKKN